ncbi:MAG: hypothetical protein WA666_04190 [Nitrospirota bacterium]
MRIKYYLLFAVVLVVLLPTLTFSGTTDPDFGALTAKEGAKAKELFNDPTLYREADLKALPTTAPDFEFLLDRPRTSVALAGKMHKSLDKYEITKTGPEVYHIDDTKQLVGDMTLINSRPGRRLYYIDGYWKIIMGVILKGRIALLVEYRETGYGKLDAKAKGYMMVDNSAAGVALKLLVKLFPAKVDARITRFATAVQKVVEGVHYDPAGTLKRLENAKNVPPAEAREFRDRFIKN